MFPLDPADELSFLCLIDEWKETAAGRWDGLDFEDEQTQLKFYVDTTALVQKIASLRLGLELNITPLMELASIDAEDPPALLTLRSWINRAMMVVNVVQNDVIDRIQKSSPKPPGQQGDSFALLATTPESPPCIGDEATAPAGIGGSKGPAPVLTEREKNVLLGLLRAGATAKSRLISAPELFEQIEGYRKAAVSSKDVMANLVSRDLINSKGGSRGGYWLTKRGCAIAERMV